MIFVINAFIKYIFFVHFIGSWSLNVRYAETRITLSVVDDLETLPIRDSWNSFNIIHIFVNIRNVFWFLAYEWDFFRIVLIELITPRVEIFKVFFLIFFAVKCLLSDHAIYFIFFFFFLDFHSGMYLGPKCSPKWVNHVENVTHRSARAHSKCRRSRYHF